MTEGDMRQIFEIVNSLHPQLTLLTGDQVDNADSQIPPLHRALEVLKAEYGVFGVLGNHDHYANAERVAAAMRDRSVTVLSNEHRTLNVNGERLSLVGIDDAGNGARNFADIDAATENLSPEGFRIFLSHRPDTFATARAHGMHLSLAGHTHGGQVGIEIGGIKINPVYLIHKYARGLYQEGGKYLYVNVGVGMVGVPIRLVRPEIAFFSLHRTAPTAA
jgi:predicted MPP superfamily phosphohydrolase